MKKYTYRIICEIGGKTLLLMYIHVSAKFPHFISSSMITKRVHLWLFSLRSFTKDFPLFHALLILESFYAPTKTKGLIVQIKRNVCLAILT